MGQEVLSRKLLCRFTVSAAIWIAFWAGTPPGFADEEISIAGPVRELWTESKIVGSPDPPPPFRQVIRFPNLRFSQPLHISHDPAGQRLWVATREAKIYSFPDDDSVGQADLFADFRLSYSELTPHKTCVKVNSTYGLAFHPQYPAVPVCWIVYTMQNQPAGNHPDDGTRLSRFRVKFDEDGVPRCDLASERILISWLEGGHNGSCLKFGPDGYLYVSAGDGEVPNPPDPRRNGQDVTNVMSSILRLDVNPADDGPLYSIPSDNPFTAQSLSQPPEEPLDSELFFSVEEARPEIWAYGFRNPWRMSFGPDGQLWVGDVGWELYEMVHNVKPGGNYGWSIFEGPQPVLPDGKRGPTPIVPAAMAYSHSEGASVTGGIVYQGTSLPELRGRYVFGDYETRRIWSAEIVKGPGGGADRLDNRIDLVEPSVRIVSFGEDTSREPLLLHFDEGRIYGLEPNDVAESNSSFPTQLSDTGLYSDTAEGKLEEGVIRFEINEPMWNDGATATRLVALPSASPINVLRKPRRMKVSSLREKLQFPVDSVLSRTVELDDDDGRSVRLETQVLHFNGKVWNPYSYIWNADQTDAQLAPAEGATIRLSDYGRFAERPTWNVHSRSECIRCHNTWVGGALAFTLPQLNCPSSSGAEVSQLQLMVDEGWFSGAMPDDPAESNDVLVRPLVRSTDPHADLDSRARSYLAVNCSHCHQNGAGGTATIDLRYEARPEAMKAIGTTPMQGTFQIPNAAIIRPGDQTRSVLLYRMACSGRGRMPHIGSETVDAAAVRLLRDWIETLDGDEPSPVAAGLTSTAEAMQALADIEAGRITGPDRNSLLLAARDVAPEIRNLFARFQPAGFRKQLNRSLNASVLLSLPGNRQTGKTVFSTKAVQCSNCHRVGGKGGQIGPALDDVGKRLSRVQILESILQPSRKIDPRYAAWTALTVEGKVSSGLLVSRDPDSIVLRTIRNENVRIEKTELEELVQQTTSLMPDRLVNDLTDQQIADLLAYLASLK